LAQAGRADNRRAGLQARSEGGREQGRASRAFTSLRPAAGRWRRRGL